MVDDAAQDSLLLMMENIRKFQPNYLDENIELQAETQLNLTSRLAAYLSTYTRWTRIKYQKLAHREAKHRQPAEDLLAQAQSHYLYSQSALDPRAASDLLATALAKASPKVREVELLSLKRLSASEIAQELGLTENAVYKCRQRFRELLKAAAPPEKMELLYETAYFEESPNNLQFDGYGFLEANSREKYELLIDGIDGLTAADRDSLKRARCELDRLPGRDDDDKIYLCRKLLELTHELKRECFGDRQQNNSLLEQCLNGLRELAPGIAAILSSLSGFFK
jgi:DNA-directed RNA polymerase specialized sigma24 family protein